MSLAEDLHAPLRVLLSADSSPVANASLEEWLFRSPVTGPTLVLYRNARAVLCGRNQSLWLECDPCTCVREGITLMRRLSGGGTVYHDEGNLNVALIRPRHEHSHQAFTDLLAEALRELGLTDLAVDSHGSLLTGGRKLCGTAIALSGGASLVHGCVLVRTELTALERALRLPPTRCVEGHGVASRRMPVTRLADHLPTVTVEALSAAVLAAATRRWGEPASLERVCPEEDTRLATYAQRFAAPSWTHAGGGAAAFTLRQTLTDGRAFAASVADGTIVRATLDDETLTDLSGQPLQRPATHAILLS